MGRAFRFSVCLVVVLGAAVSLPSMGPVAFPSSSTITVVGPEPSPEWLFCPPGRAMLHVTPLHDVAHAENRFAFATEMPSFLAVRDWSEDWAVFRVDNSLDTVVGGSAWHRGLSPSGPSIPPVMTRGSEDAMVTQGFTRGLYVLAEQADNGACGLAYFRYAD